MPRHFSRLALTVVMVALAGAARAQVPEGVAREPAPIIPPLDPQTLRAAAALLEGTPPPQDVTWTGTVTGLDLAPLAGVDVWLYPDGATIAGSGRAAQLTPAWGGLRGRDPPPMLTALTLSDCAHVVTDADGQFVISGQRASDPWNRRSGLLGLRAEPYYPLLVLAREGHAVRVQSGYRWDRQGSSVDLGRLVLVEEGVLAGRVVDAAGQPVAGATVRVTDERSDRPPVANEPYGLAGLLAERHATRTGEDGAFLLAGLCPGQVDLRIEHPQYARRDLEKIRVQSGTQVVPDTSLEAGFALSGHVVDARGKAVAGARVAAAARPIGHYGMGCVVSDFETGDDILPTQLVAAYGSDASAVRTDSAGAFTLSGLTRTSFQLFVEGQGLRPTLLADMVPPSSDLRVVLEDEAELRIRVLQAKDGAPVAAARLEVQRCQQLRPSSGSVSASTDLVLEAERLPDPGCFRVRGAGPVRSHILVIAPGFAPQSVDVPGLPAGAREDVEIRLQPSPALSGRVTDTKGRPIDGVVAILFPAENPNWPDLSQQRGDEHGAFTLPALGPGTFDLGIKAPGYGGVLLRGLDPATAVTPLAVTLDAAARLEITVGDGVGQPQVHNFDLVRNGVSREEAVRFQWLFQGTATKGAGNVLFWEDLPAGSYRLSSRDMPKHEFELRAGETKRVPLGGPGVSIRGRVTLSGRPVAGVNISLEVERSEGRFDRIGWSVTDDEGDYNAWIPCSGRCRVIAVPSMLGAVTGPRPCGLAAPARVVTASDAPAQTVDIELPAATLSGRLVRADTNEPLANSAVQLAGSELGENIAQTDEEGRFLFACVPDGQYVVESWTHGPLERGRSQALRVVDGESVADIVVYVPCGARLEVTLRRSNGAPVPDGTTLIIYRVGSDEGATWARSVTGRCIAEGLQAGRYKIEYEPASELPAAQRQAIGQSVVMPDTGTVTVELVIDSDGAAR